MIRTTSLASYNEPLLPLTDKQLQAAAESHDYALVHELFLALETDEHLQYHYSIAADEQRRIPASERSLADDHLPPLIIPTTKIEEIWTVPRRVAVVLEAACRWLEDDELKACEEAVIDGTRPSRTRPPLRKLKLERPLLKTDHDEDCAELERQYVASVSCGEDNVRKHRVPLDPVENNVLFAIPKESVDYATDLEQRIRTETMIVSEKSVNTLVSLMSSMEWTDKDQAAFLEEQLAVPRLSKRYLSPPLPPVEPFEYYIPEGDVCLVSDASDVSSGISEALEEAERLLAEETSEEWKEEAVNFDLEAFSSATPVTLFDLWSQLPESFSKKRHQETDFCISPSSFSDIGALQVPNQTTKDDVMFKSYINEAMFEEEEPTAIQDEKAHQSLGAETKRDTTAPEVNHGLDDDLSDDSCPDTGFEELTEETLLGLEENSIVVQAKLPVPSVDIESSTPGWFAVSDDPLDMFQWILKSNSTKDIILGEWLLDADEESEVKRKLEKKFATLADDCHMCDKTMDFDPQNFERKTSWLHTVPDIQPMLLASIKPVPPLKKHNITTEGFLETPKMTSKEARRDVLQGNPQETLKESPKPPAQHSPKQKSTKDAQHQEDNTTDPFGDLMGRFKKRKIQHTPSSQAQSGTSEHPDAPQDSIKITAPELLLGFRAFASPSAQTDEPTVQDEGQHDQSRSATSTVKATSIVIQDAFAVQPIDNRTTHLPKVIFSTAIPRAIRSILLQFLPSLEFVERDYQRQKVGYGDINLGGEADLVISPSTGIIISSMKQCQAHQQR
ncbi:hypothetical protein SEUCBS139899_009498 [Sporothrix eucalyptigena]